MRRWSVRSRQVAQVIDRGMMNDVVINYLDKDSRLFEVAPLDIKRTWMGNMQDKFGYRCVPLRIANTYGWSVLSPYDFSASWYGGEDMHDVEITSNDPNFSEKGILTHFGHATFTLQLDFLITTPKGYSLYIRGVPNKPYGIIKPLDAIVETDWLPWPFTYNFLFTEPGTVEFKKNEPLFIFFPIERGSIENFNLKSSFIGDNKELSEDYEEYAKSRSSATAKRKWHKEYYLEGKLPNRKINIKNHIAKLFFGTIDK
jgi:hypothetical protein